MFDIGQRVRVKDTTLWGERHLYGYVKSFHIKGKEPVRVEFSGCGCAMYHHVIGMQMDELIPDE